MGAWGHTTFESDEALDYLSNVINHHIRRARERLKVRDENEARYAMIDLEIAMELSELYDGAPRKEILAMELAILKIFDTFQREYTSAWYRHRREEIVKRFKAYDHAVRSKKR